MILKKFIKRKRLRYIIQQLVQSADIQFHLEDIGGTVVWGKNKCEESRFLLAFEDQQLGYLVGEPKAEGIANLINHIIQREQEIKQLSQETIDTYREINVFYNLAERIATEIELEPVLEIAAEEAHRLVLSHCVCILMPNSDGEFQPVSSTADLTEDTTLHPYLHKLISQLKESGLTEVVEVDHPEAQLKTILGCPLKLKDRLLGILALGFETRQEISARDIKVVSAIAAHTASAIANRMELDKAIRLIMDNVQSGILICDHEGKIQPGHTKSCDEIFATETLDGMEISTAMQLDPVTAETYLAMYDQILFPKKWRFRNSSTSLL